MLARLLPLVALLTLPACSGALPGPADGSPEAVWAELVALAASPNPDLDAVAMRLASPLGMEASQTEAVHMLGEIRTLLSGEASDGPFRYSVLNRSQGETDEGIPTRQLRLRVEGVPVRTTLSVGFVEVEGRHRLYDIVFSVGGPAEVFGFCHERQTLQHTAGLTVERHTSTTSIGSCLSASRSLRS